VGGGLFSILLRFYCSLFWGFSSVSGVWVLLFLLGFCGLALVVPVYVGAPYAFINKVFLLIKKKKEKKLIRPQFIGLSIGLNSKGG
jgi:hypothetical protein